MAEILSRCGYRCDLCAAYRASDPALMKKLCDGWAKYFGHKYTPENVSCNGCMSDGPVIDQKCQVRACVIARGIPNCAHCPDFPCEKLKPLLASPEQFRQSYKNVPQEDYDLCFRQFESLPRLLKIRESLHGDGSTH